MPLLSVRPEATFPAAQHESSLGDTKLCCLATEARRCEQLVRSLERVTARTGFEPATTRLLARRPTHCATTPPTTTTYPTTTTLSSSLFFRPTRCHLTRLIGIENKLCGRPPQYAPPCELTFGLLTLKVVSESRVTWATSVPILCSRLRPDVRNGETGVRQTSDAHHRLMPLP